MAHFPPGWRGWTYNGSIEKLAKENYVIAYNRRGHGSTRFPEGSTLEDIVKDIIALLDILCIEKVNAVGMSMGTYVLGCAAGIAPERFNSMVLIVPNSHSIGGSPGTQFVRKMGINPSTATVEELNSIGRAYYAPTTTDEMIESHKNWDKQFADLPKLPPEDVATAIKVISDFDFRDNFRNLKKPVLVMSGQYDVINTPDRGREIASLIDGGRFVEIPDCGHNLFIEQNETCVDTMLTFLRSVNG